MIAPKRIQRRRTKGWRMPDGAVYVGRPTKWGNPYLGPDAAQLFAIELRACQADPYGDAYPIEIRTIAEEVHDLAGRDLACWCPLDQPCHADVLLELANAEMPERDCPDCDAPMVEETPGDWVCWCCEWTDGGEDPQCDCCGDPLDTDHPELCAVCLDGFDDQEIEGPPPRPVETVDTGGRL